MADTCKCRLCSKIFVVDETFIPICPVCCDTLVEPLDDNLYETAEVACEVLASYGPCGYLPLRLEHIQINRDTNAARCSHCGSLDHYSHLCLED